MSGTEELPGRNQIVPFDFEGSSVRTVTVDGELHLVGKDVCDRLGYANATDAMGKHCKGVAKRYPLQTAGGMQELRILSEPDVLRLIIGSKLPAAERFERWVTAKVLPQIRQTGGYGAVDRDTPWGSVMFRAALSASSNALAAMEELLCSSLRYTSARTNHGSPKSHRLRLPAG